MPRAKDILTKLYPTPEDMNRERQNHESWVAMAKAINITKQSLYDHRERLGMTREVAGKKPKNFAVETHKAMDEAIKEIVGNESKNMVTKYKIVDPVAFFANPLGNEGLELIGVEHGPTWRNIRHLQPSALAEGRTI